jgi:hypothetical protein
MIAVGDEQLEAQRLQIVGRDARAGETVEHDEQRIDLAEVAEQLRAGPANLDDTDRCRRHLPCADDVRNLRQARIRDSRHADVAGRARTGQRVEERRLARARQPDDPNLERQRYRSDARVICFCKETNARCCNDLIAPSVLPRIVATSAFGKLKTNFKVETCCCSVDRPSISSRMLCRPIDCMAAASADGSLSPSGSGTSSSGCHRRVARK